MTILALPTADITSPAAQLADRIERTANTIGGFALLTGVMLGAVMFIAQSF